MNRKSIQKDIDHIENLFWNLKYKTEVLLVSPNTKRLSRNKNLKELHYGETCFILGNGPSLKLETRLPELSQYTTFSVNQFYRSELFGIIKPKYHVMIDPLFFSLSKDNPDENDTLRRIVEIADDPSINLILPVEAHEYITKNISTSDRCIFVKGRYKMCDKYASGFNMAGYLPASNNVVLTAIYCAIYMGFKRIVILGNDMTGLMDNYVKRSPKITEKFTHIYEYTEQEKNRMRKVHATHNNEAMLEGFTQMFKDYRRINEYCMANNIQILNASQETALDNIPFCNLNDILDGLKEINNEK